MKTAYDVILRPVITEKSMAGIADKKYVFEVAVHTGCNAKKKKAIVRLTEDSKGIEIFEGMF